MLLSINLLFFEEFEWTNKLGLVRIYFDTPTFEQITRDDAAKPEDVLSAIGGTMGLLTGFSIISGIEIIFFVFRLTWLSSPNQNPDQSHTNRV